MTKFLDFYKTFDQNLFALIIRSKPKCNSFQFKLLLRFQPLFTFLSMAIEVSSNQTIMPSEGVFQCNVSKSIDLLIFDAIQHVRLRNKRPHSSVIFKEISKTQATNFTEEDIENRTEDIINEKKLVNNKTIAGLDSYFVTSFVKETFTESNTKPIPITHQTPEVCKVSTQTEDSNIDPRRTSSLEVRMAALKSSFMDEIYDLKNQIESNNTGKHESDLVFSLREQIKLLKEENENKTFIIKSLLQIKIIYQTCEQTFSYNNVNCSHLIKTFLKRYQWTIVFQKVNIQLKFIQKNN